ncbi:MULTISPECIES: esterase/lipase family protein [Amycolatopsis]|uniref:Alpha/beta fold hydrolase n=1 Tax=Amycolatopsis thermalba TaxID=944492 RepID=A0ABY4P098_9PSEU|nr:MULTISPECIES: alpha/beta fold hydrolase [Amycolatopsis]OXM63944.1 triacylglycerol lipase [Amycolatopsis sp. KNN50.9b]UQS25774.1 alpha/beta fold hydrolase [Amycolatopsis thermalba]
MSNRRRRALSAILAALTTVTGAVLAAPPAQAATAPEAPDFPAAFAYSQFVDPNATPPGANDWTCRPGADHPRAVVLVHGTWENRYDNFARLSPSLKRDGYCVFALNYGEDPTSVFGLNPAFKGTGDIRRSAQELAAFVDRVLAATGTSEVDVVGHSQGGLMPREYLRHGGAAKVHTLVTLGATHHGTTLSGIATLAGELGLLPYTDVLLGKAAGQQVRGSEFLTDLNAGGDTVPGVRYLVIATRYDEVTTPYESTFLTGEAVRNVTLQDGCEIDLSDHLSMSYSPRAIGYVKQGLDPAAPEPPCVPHLPVF